MSNESDLIRAAFSTIAAEAVDGSRIREVLTRRSRTARQRRVVLRLAGAGGVAVVVGGAALGVRNVLDRAPDSPVATVPGGPGGGWLPAPWQFRPGWLPGGYGQSDYSVSITDSAVTMVNRTWQLAEATVSVLVGLDDSALPFTGRPTSVVLTDGVRADLYEDEYNAHVTWHRPGLPVLTVSAGDSTHPNPAARRNQALKVARSLRTDAGRGYVGPHPTYLPTGYEKLPWMYLLHHEGLAWRQELILRGDGHGMVDYEVTIGPKLALPFDTSAATPATVRGLRGWTSPTQNQVFVTLPDGRDIHARGGLDGDAPKVLRLVNDLDPGPVPDMTWVGGR